MTFTDKPYDATDKDKLEAFFARTIKENPSYWPNGLSVRHFDEIRTIHDKTGYIVGFLGWQDQKSTGGERVGYYSVAISPWHRGRGLAKRFLQPFLAARKSSVDVVRALVHPSNKASIALAESLGIPHAPKSSDFTKAPLSATVLSMSAQSLRKSAAGPPGAAGAIWRMLGGSVAGAGLAGVENSFLIDNPAVQKVNLLAGALTGAGVAAGGSYRKTAINMLTPKQLGIIGMDQYAKNAPLRADTAKTENATANTQFDTAKLTQGIGYGALGLGALGLALYARNSFAGGKAPAPKPKSSTTNTTLQGDPKEHRHNKVTIQLPAASLPDEFYASLVNADNRPKALMTLQDKSASVSIEQLASLFSLS